MSRRMGQFKPLLPFGGKPMVIRVIESLAEAGGIDSVVVVIGHRAHEMRVAISGGTGASPVQSDERTGGAPVPRVSLVHNSNYEHGEMLSSIKVGVRALPDEADAFLLTLGDQPAVKPETICHLLAAWRGTRAALVSPKYLDRRGHPIILSSKCIPEILGLRPDETLKTFMQRRANEILEVPVEDPAVICDVDTPQDYEQALRLWETRRRAQRTEGGAYARQ